MKSRPARRSGLGHGMKLARSSWAGMVDHRLDHMDNGRLSPTGAPRILVPTVGDLHPVPEHATDRPVTNARGLVGQQWNQRLAMGAMFELHAEGIGDGGVQIDVRGERIDLAAAGSTLASGS